MTHRAFSWIVLLAAMMASLACAQTAPPHLRNNLMPSDAMPNAKQLIVTYKDGPGSPSANAANAAVGTIFVRPMGSGNTAVVTLPPNADLNQAMTQLRSQPGVTHVEINAQKTVDPIRGPVLQR